MDNERWTCKMKNERWTCKMDTKWILVHFFRQKPSGFKCPLRMRSIIYMRRRFWCRSKTDVLGFQSVVELFSYENYQQFSCDTCILRKFIFRSVFFIFWSGLPFFGGYWTYGILFVTRLYIIPMLCVYARMCICYDLYFTKYKYTYLCVVIYMITCVWHDVYAR